jgi:hypothetical protein
MFDPDAFEPVLVQEVIIPQPDSYGNSLGSVRPVPSLRGQAHYPRLGANTIRKGGEVDEWILEPGENFGRRASPVTGIPLPWTQQWVTALIWAKGPHRRFVTWKWPDFCIIDIVTKEIIFEGRCDWRISGNEHHLIAWSADAYVYTYFDEYYLLFITPGKQCHWHVFYADDQENFKFVGTGVIDIPPNHYVHYGVGDTILSDGTRFLAAKISDTHLASFHLTPKGLFQYPNSVLDMRLIQIAADDVISIDWNRKKIILIHFGERRSDDPGPGFRIELSFGGVIQRVIKFTGLSRLTRPGQGSIMDFQENRSQLSSKRYIDFTDFSNRYPVYPREPPQRTVPIRKLSILKPKINNRYLNGFVSSYWFGFGGLIMYYGEDEYENAETKTKYRGYRLQRWKFELKPQSQTKCTVM